MDTTNRTTDHSNRVPEVYRFLIIAYGFTWLVWTPGILASFGILSSVPWPPLFAIGVCGPLIAALICLYREGGWPAVQSWFKKGFSQRVKGFWWFVILLIPFIIPALALGFYRILGGETMELRVLQQPWILLPTILLMITIGGGQEEYGWRGYLLPKLDERFRTWQADLIMIPLHACWHLPLFFISYTMQSHYPFWLFLVFGIGLTLMINRVFRSTGGSFVSTILFHGFVNAGLEVFPSVGPFVNNSYYPLLTISLLYLLLGLMLSFITTNKNREGKIQ